MFKYDKSALIETGKSFLRFIWFGVLGLVVTFLTSLTTSQDLLNTIWTVGDVAIPVGVWLVGGIGFAIKALDRYIHQSDNTKLNGLAPNILQR